uniref:Uncharacterized protein n=1 Tax=Salix viminalis TaxID=40686 RepID=A0A6N2LBJ9_SALVM
MRGATRGLPGGVSGGRFPCSSYGIVLTADLRFQDSSGLVEAALVNSGTKYRVDCGGGGVSDFGAGGIKSREGHSFEPHSLIAVGLQRLSGITTWGEKRGELSGADKKEKGTGNKMRGATRGLPRRSPILVLLSPKHV